ncbi:hypothetical protein [Nocardioides halotolerans]|uniref:hypothetical protein n=1 Tax=Nocardioides halotolerans TaxID=433660 RepID=UPI000428B001|nr:hypothetical protein [Nocardioides halotolerans]
MSADHDHTDLDHELGLTTALRDRMEDVRPDLDRLTTVARCQGTRIRRRTRIASAAGVLAVAAVVGGIAVATSGGDHATSPRGQQPGFAAEPSASSSTGPTDPAAPSATPGAAVPPATTTTAPGGPQTLTPPRPETSPVALALPGWTCAPPADEKFICTTDDGRAVQVTWRPGKDRHYWGDSPDKSADFISNVHGRFFVTVDAARGTPSAAAVTVGQALVWR